MSLEYRLFLFSSAVEPPSSDWSVDVLCHFPSQATSLFAPLPVCAWAEWGGDRLSSALLTFPSLLCSWGCCPVSCWQELPALPGNNPHRVQEYCLCRAAHTRVVPCAHHEALEWGGVKGEGFYLSVLAASCSSGRMKSWQPLLCYCLFLPWQGSGSAWDFWPGLPQSQPVLSQSRAHTALEWSWLWDSGQKAPSEAAAKSNIFLSLNWHHVH